MIYNRVKIKHSINILLISIFCLSIVRPVFPYFEYIINFEYITEVLCINKEQTELNCLGKCYLNEALSGTSDEDSNQNKRIPTIELEKFDVYFNKGGFTINKFHNYNNFSIGTYEIFVQNHLSKPPTPPPKC